MKVRYSYLRDQFKETSNYINAIEKVVKASDYTLGKELEKFEKSFAKLIGCKFAVGVNSGTDAIKLGLKALDVGYGDEVITSANTFVATIGPIIDVGAKPVFVDCSSDGNMIIDQVINKVTSKTKCVIPVHWAGEPANVLELKKLLRPKAIKILEDCCQGILAHRDGANCGTFGSLGAFSLHPLKNLNVWGDGGVITTNKSSLFHKLRLLRNHGLSSRDKLETFGLNSRLDTIQAAIGSILIKDAQKIAEKRHSNGTKMDLVIQNISDLTNGIITPLERRPDSFNVYHLFQFFCSGSIRDNLLKHLHSSKIEAKIHYPVPLLKQKPLKALGFNYKDYPIASKFSMQSISLPIDQHLSVLQLRHIERSLYSFFNLKNQDFIF